MEPQIWYLPAVCVALWKEGSEKGQSPLLTLMADTLVSPYMPLGPFKLVFKRNFLGLQKFLPPTQFLLIFATKSFGDLSSWHWNPGLGDLGGGETPCSKDVPLKILSTIHGCGTNCSVYLPLLPVWMDVVFFSSVAVRLPFNLISDCSEWWLFYILVVILMWLYEEASHVCLLHHR